MPKHQQVISVNEFDKEHLLAICYGTFKSLGWDVMFAGETALVGQTIKSWKTNSLQVATSISGNQITVSSEMVHGESLDVLGKNKKAVETFINSFYLQKGKQDDEETGQNLRQINELRIATSIKVAQEERDAAEIDEVMNLSKGNL